MVLQKEVKQSVVVDRNSDITGDKIEENLTLFQVCTFIIFIFHKFTILFLIFIYI